MSIIVGIIALSIVVFAHELGHFLAAKLSGIEVERFSIGIGPRLVGFKRGNTDYCISILPLGGFCKMKGEDSFAKALGKGEDVIAAEPGSFYAAHPLKRAFVGFTGPFFNFVFAVLALSALYTIGFTIYDNPNRVLLSSSIPGQSLVAGPGLNPADQSGLMSGDRIIAVDGTATPYYSDIQEEISARGGRKTILSVERGSERIELTVTPYMAKKGEPGRIGVLPLVEPLVAAVNPKGPAARAGLRTGDRIIAVNGRAVDSAEVFRSAIDEEAASFEIVVIRADGERKLNIYPDIGSGGKPVMGFDFPLESYPSPEYGPIGGMERGFKETLRGLGSIVKGIGLLFTKPSAKNSIMGPARMIPTVGAITMAGFSAGFADGITSLLELLAMISLSLLVMNLLPIPVLDGGLIVIFLLEAIRRKPLKMRTLYRVTMAGLAVVAAIFLFATFSDILFYALRK